MFIVVGEATFTNNPNQSNARSRMETAMAGYSFEGYASIFPAGVGEPSNSILTISVIVNTDDVEVARLFRRDVYNAWIGTGGSARHTSGWLGVNQV